MGLRDKLQDDLTVTLKNGELSSDAKERKLTTLRGLLNVVNAVLKENPEAGEADLVKAVAKAAKQRQDSIKAYEEGGREELAATEKAELEIIGEYLPEQMSEEAVRAVVQAKIEAAGGKGECDMGKIIGLVMAEIAGQTDGGTVSRIVKEELES